MNSKRLLTDLPIGPLKLILEIVDFRSIINLRKVSFELRNFIDYLRPVTHLKSITITVSTDSIYIYMDLLMDWSIDIEYRNRKTGYSVQCGRIQRVIENEDFINGFFDDFYLNLKNQRDVLQFFRLNSEVFLVDFSERIAECLMSRNEKLRVKELNFDVSCQEEILSVLPFIDPNEIKKISISSQEYDLKLDQIVQLDQWKKAEKLEIFDFVISESIENFRHFSKAKIHVEVISSDELDTLKESFLNNSKFSIFTIKYEFFNDSPDFRNFFGDPDIENKEQWSFRIPGKNDQAILLVHYDNHVFRFSRVDFQSIHDK